MKTAKDYLDEANAVVKKIDFDAALHFVSGNRGEGGRVFTVLEGQGAVVAVRQLSADFFAEDTSSFLELLHLEECGFPRQLQNVQTLPLFSRPHLLAY